MSIWDTIKSAASTVAGGVSTAISTVTTGVTDVVEQLDPELQELKSNYKILSTHYNALRVQVQQEVTSFDNLNNIYKTYAGLAGGLFILNSMVNMDDDQFNDFLEATKTAPPTMEKSNYLPADVASFMKKELGSVSDHVINGVYRFDELKKAGWFSSSLTDTNLQNTILEGLTVSLGVGTLGAIAPLGVLGTVMSLAGPVALVGGVGVVIANIVNDTKSYEEANSKLDQGITEMNYNLDAIRSAMGQLGAAIGQLKITTISILKALNDVKPCNFTWQLTQYDADASFLTALHSAYLEYSIIGTIKMQWQNFHNKYPDQTVSEFKYSVTRLSDPNYSDAQISAFVDIVVKPR